MSLAYTITLSKTSIYYYHKFMAFLKKVKSKCLTPQSITRNIKWSYS